MRTVTILSVLLLAQFPNCLSRRTTANSVAISSYRNDYDDGSSQEDLLRDQASDFSFQRFQSPSTIQRVLKNTHRVSPFKWYQGKDGRRGYVSSTKLMGDWVLAQSKQVAVQCSTEEVLQAYLSGELQQQWNDKDVLECTFRKIEIPRKLGSAAAPKILTRPDVNNNESTLSGKRNLIQKLGFKVCNLKKIRTESIRTGTPKLKNFVESHRKSTTKNSALQKLTLSTGIYYQQDLVLKSQRIISSQTGIMRYSQIITIDKIGHDSYSVLVQLDPDHQRTQATTKKPFESLSVYVGLQQNGKNVDIYAAGVMKVNRQVVPNLIIFDASGIAGGMAGKGTLWLAGFFYQRYKNKLKET